eukprot:gene13674-13796_t
MATTGRPMRPAAVKAQTFFGNLSQGGPYADGSDNEDDEYLAKQGRNPRRFANSRIDLTKLELVSLQRYRKAYKLPDHPAGSREDLLTTIIRHFSDVYVDEDETLIRFAMACRRNGQQLGLASIKKPRSGSVRPRGR